MVAEKNPDSPKPSIDGPREGAIKWAKKLLKRDDWVILHSLSVGKGKKEVISQIGIISPQGTVLFDSLVRPPRKHRMAKEELHRQGLDRQALSNAPKFAAVLPELRDVLIEKQIVTFDTSFHKRLFHRTIECHQCPRLKLKWADCVQSHYRKFLECSPGDERFTEADGIGQDDTAIDRAHAILKLIKQMAAQKIPKHKSSVEKTSRSSARRQSLLRIVFLIILLSSAVTLLYLQGFRFPTGF